MCAVPNMAVFCSFLTSCFPGVLLTYFLNDFEIVPVASIIIIIIIIIIAATNNNCNCHAVAVILTLVQTKQIRINIHKRKESYSPHSCCYAELRNSRTFLYLYPSFKVVVW